MTDQTQIQADAAAEAPAKVAKAIADTVATVATETTKTAKRARAATKRRSKRKTAKTAKSAKPAVVARKARASKTARRTTRTTKTAARKPAAAAFNQRIPTMNFIPNNVFGNFDAFTGTNPFQSLFAESGERSQEAVKKSQKVAQELAEISKANVEAIVEAGKVAVEGARSISQDALARGREGAEQAADAIRSLAEAKSPTEFVQLQGELARTSFDRMVAETSKLTESMVKLAGKAFQPLSNRATANAQSLNNIVA
ncbi:MAG: phasin family protein [Sphingomicrobium sp.]